MEASSLSTLQDSQPTYPNIVVPSDPNADPREHARLTSPLTLKQEQVSIQDRQTMRLFKKTSSHGVNPGMPQGTVPRPSGSDGSTSGIQDAAPAL